MENLIEEIDVVIKKYLDDRVQVDVNYRESFIRKLSEKVDDVEVTLERADRISHSAFVDVQELNKEFTAVEELHIRDANRIAALELTVMGLNEGLFDAERNANRIAKLEREITELHNSYLVNRESQKIENDRLLTRESIEKSGISSSRVTDLLHAAKRIHSAVCATDTNGRVCLAKSFPEILSVAQMYGRADEFLDSLSDEGES
jgi:predicted RND superfamily exporter protein